jgi:hypothetical protein
MLMLAKLGSVAVVFAAFTSVAFAQPIPKPADDKKLVTKVYNIKPLIGERGRASNFADGDAVVKLIFQTISFGEPKEVPQVIERDGGKLEIRTTENTHGEIKDLLEAVERLQDVAIDAKAEVYELDTATYEKLVKSLPKPKGKPGLPVLLATGEETEEGKEAPAIIKALEDANKVLKGGRLVQTSKGRYVNGMEATVSARRSIIRFTNHGEPAWKPTDNPLSVKDGFSLIATPVVSMDRRFIRFKLTEQSTIITGIKKRELGEINGQKIVAQSPKTEDLGATGSAEVADGGTVIFKLAYAPKEKVWVVVLKPTIFIQAEEDELKKEGK